MARPGSPATPQPTLTGVDAKIGRAKAHAAELKERLGEVLSPDQQSFILERDVEDDDYVLRVYGLPLIDTDWALVAGDCIHNVRTALDHLAYQLVLLDGGVPCEHTQFPIYESRLNKKGQRIVVTIQPQVNRQDIRDLLEEVQPYADLQGPPGPFQTANPLALLRRLDNIDKHRLLFMLVAMPQVSSLEWVAHPDLESVELPWEELQEGAPVARLKFRRDEPPADYDPKPPIHVMLNEPETVGWSLPDFLTFLVGYIETVVLGSGTRPVGFRRFF